VIRQKFIISWQFLNTANFVSKVCKKHDYSSSKTVMPLSLFYPQPNPLHLRVEGATIEVELGRRKSLGVERIAVGKG